MHVAGPRRLLARAGAFAAALLATVVVAGPAYAAPSGGIDGFQTNADGTLSIAFSAVGLEAGQTIEDVVVRIGGSIVPSTSTLQTAVADKPVRTTFLVMDVSGSMAGTKLVNAKTAANAYVDGVPDDVRVGLISFDDTAAVRLSPTTDRGALRTAIGALATNRGDTALYDAILLATQKLGTTGIRSQLVLSDGEDTASKNATAASTAAAVKKSGSTLDAVAFGTTAAALTPLALAGDGKVVQASDAASLTAAFASVAQAQASAVLIRATVPDALRGTSQTVLVTATAGTTPIVGQGLALMPAATSSSAAASPSPTAIPTEVVAVPAPDLGIFASPWVLPVAIGALALGLFVLLAVAFLATDPEAQTAGRVRRRLSRYSLSTRQESSTASSGALGDSQVARSAVELAGRVVQRRDLDTSLGTKLEAAGVPLKPAEWMIIHIAITIGAGLLFALLSSFGWLATIIGLVLGLALPYVYLAIKEERRKARFQAQLPETLQLLAGSLAAGYSLPQAVDTVVRESDGPMAVELNRAIVEARLGVPMEDALETIARRMNSVDFAWVAMAIRIQREVGGNLAEVLTSVAATMRERERLRRQVQVLSAEGRLSAIILVALPLLFVVYLIIARPEYLSSLITTPLGLLMIVIGIVLLIVGSFWLRKVVKVEV